eukprot:768288-Hanusia_phi.AAC.3
MMVRPGSVSGGIAASDSMIGPSDQRLPPPRVSRMRIRDRRREPGWESAPPESCSKSPAEFPQIPGVQSREPVSHGVGGSRVE